MIFLLARTERTGTVYWFDPLFEKKLSPLQDLNEDCQFS